MRHEDKLPRSVIFKAAGSGLANRLRALVGYQALSYVLDVPFYLCWIPDAACDTAFSSLFETEVATIGATALQGNDPELRIYDQADWFTRIWSDHLSDRLPLSEFLPQVRRYLNKLVPVHSIQERVNAFASMHGIKDALGVHIRHTDNIQTYETWARASPRFDIRRTSSLSGFTLAIESFLPNRPVFLATDSQEIEELCDQRYERQLLRYPKQYTNESLRTSSIGDALTEMLLLGRCQEILGTYYSSFGKFSAMWCNTGYREVIGTSYERNALVDDMLNVTQTLHASFEIKRQDRD